ncbi:hypothetical protein LEM8419_03514 [Neolewinella maritima]|uniref:Uncharacterized protein n=1 Tax=Neolewinella maritima TaxID=1383882 RepID=A0ABM9B5H9_9BACT|nr:hypothetical protein [Neolewinella maritima]CAH1002642.1 hypothetical protein LEM8419_03514 [Neolewinella maritima]
MKFIIRVTDLASPGEVRHYSNLKLAVVDIESPYDQTYRSAMKAKKAAAKKEHPQDHLLEGYKKGYPFVSGGCRFDAIPVYETSDCFERDEDWSDDGTTVSDGLGTVAPANCPLCGAEMQVIRPGDIRCSAECQG